MRSKRADGTLSLSSGGHQTATQCALGRSGDEVPLPSQREPVLAPALFETGSLLPAERIRTEESFFFLKKVFRPHQLTLLVYFCLEPGSGAARAHGQRF